MIIYHQQLEKALLYFQWLSTALIALHECTLPIISVLKQVMHISLQKPRGKKPSLFYSIHHQKVSGAFPVVVIKKIKTGSFSSLIFLPRHSEIFFCWSAQLSLFTYPSFLFLLSPCPLYFFIFPHLLCIFVLLFTSIIQYGLQGN